MQNMISFRPVTSEFEKHAVKYQSLLFERTPFSTFVLTFEPLHDKTNKMVCAPSEGSGHLPSLISLRYALNGKLMTKVSLANSEDSHQTSLGA